VFRSLYPSFAALEKYGKEALSSEELWLLIGSAEGWCILKSPTTKVGKGVFGRARVGDTVFSVAIEPHTL